MSQLYFFQSSLELEVVQELSFEDKSAQLLKMSLKTAFHRSLDADQVMAGYSPKIKALYVYLNR